MWKGREGIIAGASERPDDATFPIELERRSLLRRPPLHFRRLELKYFVPERQFAHLAARLAPYTEVDPYLVRQGTGSVAYPVTSLYFDSHDLQAFEQKAQGDYFRRKIRLRTYQPEFSSSGRSFLEIKRRLDAVVIKDRLALPAGVLQEGISMSRLLRHLLDAADSADPTAVEAELMAGWLNLGPTAVVRYMRSSRVAREDRTMRVTLDHDLEGAFLPSKLLGPQLLRGVDNINASGMDGISGKYAMLELKTNRAIPSGITKVIRDLQLTRTAYSKYFLVVAALRPQVYADCHPRFMRRAS